MPERKGWLNQTGANIICKNLMKLIPSTFRIFVQALDEAKGFYAEKLQWDLAVDASNHGYLVFEPGNLTVIVERTDRKESDEEGGLLGRFTGLSLAVEDMETTVSELKRRGVEITAGPEQQAWGGVLAWFKDPEGNILTLVEQGSSDPD